MKKIIIVYALVFVLAVNLALAFSFADITGYSLFKSPKNECFRSCKDTAKTAEEQCKVDEKNDLANCGKDKSCQENVKKTAKECKASAKSQLKSCKSCCDNTFKDCKKKSKEALKACKGDDVNDDDKNDGDDNDENEKECHQAAKDVLKNCQFNCNAVPCTDPIACCPAPNNPVCEPPPGG